MDAKRRRTHGSAANPHQSGDPVSDLAEVLQRLSLALRQTGDGAEATDAGDLGAVLDELSSLEQPAAAAPGAQPLQAAVWEAAETLQAAAEQLQAVIDTWAPLEADIPRGAPAVAPADVLAYAHRLSYSTFAPPGFIPGQTPLRHFKPPAPQELQLRSSLLHEHHRKWEAARTAAKQQPLHRPLQQAQQAVRADAPPARPPQPAAAPVSPALLDLSKLPPMPAGWKPGDPIPGLGPPPALPAEAPAAPAAAVKEEEEEDVVAAKPAPALAPAALPPVSRPLSLAFDFSLNPDLTPVFDASSEEDSSESE